MSEPLKFSIEMSAFLLREALSIQEGQDTVTVNAETLRTLLDAHANGVAECKKIDKAWGDYERPKDLRWYENDDAANQLSERQDVADDIHVKLTGESLS